MRSMFALIISGFLVGDAIGTPPGWVKDEKGQTPILVGLCDVNCLFEGELFRGLNKRISIYKPVTRDIKQLCSTIQFLATQIKGAIMLGLWSSGCKQEGSRFTLINRQLGIPVTCVDRQKTTSGVVFSALKIKRRRIYRFYRNGSEIGRIFENPHVAFECDMINLPLIQ